MNRELLSLGLNLKSSSLPGNPLFYIAVMLLTISIVTGLLFVVGDELLR